MSKRLQLFFRLLTEFRDGWHIGYTRPLVLVLLTIDPLVTLAFRADVEAQRGAYATGVPVLMLSAAVAAALALWREDRWLLSLDSWRVSVIIATVIAFSAASRYRRATELRVADVRIVDEESTRLWRSVISKKVNLVPIRSTNPRDQQQKAAEIRR